MRQDNESSSATARLHLASAVIAAGQENRASGCACTCALFVPLEFTLSHE